MKREILIKKLNNFGYSESTINSLVSGRRLPSMKRAIEMSNEIPVHYWKDIKSFISNSNDTAKSNNSSTIKAS